MMSVPFGCFIDILLALTATPQKSAKMMMIGGFNSIAMNVLGVKADTIWPRVTEKISVTRTMKKL
jgi:hypothetical protein